MRGWFRYGVGAFCVSLGFFMLTIIGVIQRPLSLDDRLRIQATHQKSQDGTCSGVLTRLSRVWEMTLIVMDPDLLKDSNSTSLPPVLSFGILEAQATVLAKHSVDPRYFHRDPVQHKADVPLRNTHLLFTADDCLIHIALLVPRGSDEAGKPAYIWIAPVDLEDYSRNVSIRYPARAFTMQKLSGIPGYSTLARLVPDYEFLSAPVDMDLFLWQHSFPYMECPYHNAQHFMRNHFNTTNEKLTRPMKTKLREGMLVQMNRLDELRLPAFLVAGSLLGWARECDILSYADIPKNTDVDFAVYARDTPGQGITDLLARSAKKNPTMRRAIGNYKIGSYEIRWSWKFTPPLPLYTNIAFDLFFLFPNKDGPMAHYSIFYTGEKRWWGNIHVPFVPLKEICSSDLNGVLVRVPCAPLGFLEAGYGAAWDEPHQKWSYGGGRKVNFHVAGNWTKAQDASMQQTKFE